MGLNSGEHNAQGPLLWPFHIWTLEESWGQQILREHHALRKAWKWLLGWRLREMFGLPKLGCPCSVLGHPDQEGKGPGEGLKRENKGGKQELTTKAASKGMGQESLGYSEVL